MFSSRRLKQALNAVRRSYQVQRGPIDVSATDTPLTILPQRVEVTISKDIEDVEDADAFKDAEAGGDVSPGRSSKKHREALLQRAHSLAACYVQNATGGPSVSFATCSDLPPFQHTSLKSGQIRLLKMTQEVSGVYTQLEDFALESHPAYTCMSYVWGSSNHDTSIPCNNRSLAVTDRLRQGLLCIHATKLTTDPAWFWIDAICINQADHAEKAAQVTRLHEIFASADLVLGYLGPESHNSHQAFGFMPHAIRSLWNLYDRGYYNGKTQARNWEAVGEPHRSSAWTSLYGMFGLEYWFRLWIVQEVVGRRIGGSFDILCGHDRTTGSILLEIAHLLFEMGMTVPSTFNKGLLLCNDLYTLRQLREIWARGGNELGLVPSSLLDLVPTRQVTVPLDKIYAVLSLLGPMGRAAFEVDYSDSSPRSVRKVATQYSRLLLKLEGTAHLYRLYPLSETSILPSWAFDLWSQSTNIDFWPCADWRAGHDPDMKSLNEGVEVRDGVQDTVICLRGFLIDHVQDLHKMHWGYASKDDSTIATRSPGDFLRSVEASKALVARSPIASEEDLARVLVANSIPQHPHSAAAHKSCDDEENLFFRLEQVSSMIRKQHEEGDSRVDFHLRATGSMSSAEYQYFMQMLRRCLERSFCVTGSGLMGLSRIETRTGDQIVIFEGDVMPQVVRAQGDGTYKIIRGGCYIHGLMRGELFDMPYFKEKGWADLQIS